MTRDLEQAKGLLGHSRISTPADIYLHPSKTVRAEGPQAIADMLLKGKGRDKVESNPARCVL
jgi:hypothetical protein